MRVLPRFVAAILVAGFFVAPAFAEEAPGHHGDGHSPPLYHLLRAEVDYARDGGDDLASWDAEGWLGGDEHKLWLKSEGEIENGRADRAEFQALYSRNITSFFDAQIGMRYDMEPTHTAYLVAGIQGLAPYFLETDLAAFVSEHGDVSFRLKQSIDILLTQRLIVEPHAEASIYLQDVFEEGKGTGLSEVEAALQLRYETTRKFAPFTSVRYTRSLGETQRIARAAGESAGRWTIRSGVRFWF